MKVIDNFTGDYFFLSNFFPCRMVFNGQTYENSEAAYQAQKAPADKRILFVDLEPDDAKKLGRSMELPLDWDETKEDVMHSIVQTKFGQHPELAEKLIATGESFLIEGNTWHDNFFGACRCEDCRMELKHNALGNILMWVRDELQKQMAI